MHGRKCFSYLFTCSRIVISKRLLYGSASRFNDNLICFILALWGMRISRFLAQGPEEAMGKLSKVNHIFV